MELSNESSIDVRASLDALPHGFVRVDAENRVIDWNQHMEQWTRLTREEVCGRPIGAVFRERPQITKVIGAVRKWRQPQVLSQAFHRYFFQITLPQNHI
ncbi:MAG: PAS domain-containing protein [Candidatus Synoicihabitans palmerolidicus]|nr:PAS domain-containing protein [Candidatus Synoicihabitans palmerolidicus]